MLAIVKRYWYVGVILIVLSILITYISTIIINRSLDKIPLNGTFV